MRKNALKAKTCSGDFLVARIGRKSFRPYASENIVRTPDREGRGESRAAVGWFAIMRVINGFLLDFYSLMLILQN